MGDYSARDKQKAVERELSYRRFVYPKRVADKKMKQADADYQVAIFQAIADDYREKAEAERSAGDLFGREAHAHG